ncbi:hypothetical protein AKO1_006023 [Acrasis kona]|uniref:Homeobox domain-containing protein n=1 Tax=Acrasis kona TaxID=1008807 RepID=A0AAW2ZKF8_9EUKA
MTSSHPYNHIPQQCEEFRLPGIHTLLNYCSDDFFYNQPPVLPYISDCVRQTSGIKRQREEYIYDSLLSPYSNEIHWEASDNCSPHAKRKRTQSDLFEFHSPVSRDKMTKDKELIQRITPETIQKVVLTKLWEDTKVQKSRKRNTHFLSSDAVNILREWFQDNIEHPYPTSSDKEELSRKTGLTYLQVSNWFTNSRKRLWVPKLKKQSEQESN